MVRNQRSERLTYTIYRSHIHGFGITIASGVPGSLKSFSVRNVVQGGPADGKLRCGDRIISINGVPLKNLNYISALKLVKESFHRIVMVVERPTGNIARSDDRLLTLTFSKRNEPCGVMLGCKFYVKEILRGSVAEEDGMLEPGDEIIKINGKNLNDLTLKEAAKLIDKSKDTVSFSVVKHSRGRLASHSSFRTYTGSSDEEKLLNGSKVLMTNNSDNGLSKLYSGSINNDNVDRFVDSDEDCGRFKEGGARIPIGFKRRIKFSKEGGEYGIRIIGGNKYGIFVYDVQTDGPAHSAGVRVGDKIFRVNGIDFTDFTREEAILALQNMKTTEIEVVVGNYPDLYSSLLKEKGDGDSFHIRVHFEFIAKNEDELSFNANDILHVSNTLFNGEIGYWVASTLEKNGERQTGIIPNRQKADKLLLTAPTLESILQQRHGLKKKILNQMIQGKKRQLEGLVEFHAIAVSTGKYPAYERVMLRHAIARRPVVIMGPLADIARDRLAKEHPEKFEIPHVEIPQSGNKGKGGVIKLKNIKDVMKRGMHALLDITPTAIDQLNYTQNFPIVIFLRAKDKNIIKEIRSAYGKLYNKSVRHLLENSDKQEVLYSHLICSKVEVDGSSWFRKLKQKIENEQNEAIWVSVDRSVDFELNGLVPSSKSSFICDKGESSRQSSFKHLTNRVSSEPCIQNAFVQMDKINYLTDSNTDSIAITNGSRREHVSKASLGKNVTRKFDRFSSCDTFNDRVSEYNGHEDTIDRNYLSRRMSIATPCRYVHSADESGFVDKANSHSTKCENASCHGALGTGTGINGGEEMNLCRKQKDTQQNINWSNLIRDYNAATANSRLRALHSRSLSLCSREQRSPQQKLWSQMENWSEQTESNLQSLLYARDNPASQKALQKVKPIQLSPYHNIPRDKNNQPKSCSYINPAFKKKEFRTSDQSSCDEEMKLSQNKKVTTSNEFKEDISEKCAAFESASNCQQIVIGSASGIFDMTGGILRSPETGVQLIIPSGALSCENGQEIYFNVCQERQVDQNGERCNPLILCGPPGLCFKKPIQLVIPKRLKEDFSCNSNEESDIDETRSGILISIERF